MVHARKRGFSLTEVLVCLALISGSSLLLLKKQAALDRAVLDVHVVSLSEAHL
ncbi:MAG: prepilin-type N-terminal cleavage/methylation domain-containing protein [Gammaproteobacteria bacterium]|nr:prepilin-type N-terminal cleavage/methylation domain-containing protein [Gammaproteobacteria bacterium]